MIMRVARRKRASPPPSSADLGVRPGSFARGASAGSDESSQRAAWCRRRHRVRHPEFPGSVSRRYVGGGNSYLTGTIPPGLSMLTSMTQLCVGVMQPHLLSYSCHNCTVSFATTIPIVLSSRRECHARAGETQVRVPPCHAER